MFTTHLTCRACDTSHPKEAVGRCVECGEGLDPVYDWDRLRAAVDRDRLRGRPATIWRYRELLPLDADPTVSTNVGWTPLVEAQQLAEAIGVARLWIKNEGCSFPSLSFKDRPVATAMNKAVELGIRVVGAPSTGNLANAVASHAARAGLDAWIFLPEGTETGKVVATGVYGPQLVHVRGTYDDANRLAGEAAATFGWGIINGNLRPYYSEGSKTIAFEVAEQLGWHTPSAVVAPMGGGALVTKIAKGFDDLQALGWVTGARPRVFGAQASGCAPIAQAIFDDTTSITPVTPNTAVRSIAVGVPEDGRWAADAIRRSGGWAATVDDDAMREGIMLLARTEGVFTETAGGVTVMAARQLVESGHLAADDEVVLCITGNGLKTVEAVPTDDAQRVVIEPDLAELKALVR